MSNLPKRLTGFTLYMNGKDKSGLITSIKLPQLSIKSEGFQSGGMNMPVPIISASMEMMETEITLAEYDMQVMRNFGNVDESVQLEARGIARLDKAYQTMVIKMGGYITTVPGWEWSAGESATSMTFTMQLNYYAIDVDGVNVIEIDPVNMKRVINGKDQLELVRLFLMG